MSFLTVSKELLARGLGEEVKDEVRNLMITGPPNSERKVVRQK